MNRYQNRVALVTGGLTGIGFAIASRLRSEGARVFTAQRTLSKETHSIQADFSDTSSAVTVINSVIDEAGKLDVLINNAGMMNEASVDECSLEAWQQTLTVNLTTPFLLIKAALPYLKNGGAIVNIGSIEGLGANPNHPAYCASKSGLHGLTRAVAIDHGADGIRCNAVAPGWINTKLNDSFIESMSNVDAFRQSLANIHPVGNTGQPEEVASLVAYLASDEASFISGQVYTVDGGRMAKLSLPNTMT